MAGPEYTKGKRRAKRIQYSMDGGADTLIYVRDQRGRHGEICVGGFCVDLSDRLYSNECEGNARLHAASNNAVLELAEHLGCNAVELAERLEGGGLTEIAVALGAICAATEPGEDPDIGLLHRIASSALSHLTPAPR